MHKWGAEGMFNLTPLWLLKYLPNMLACHVTIIHDTQGPSNTITCAEASSGLSVGESLRVIQRGQADLCFCGGAESKINPMAFYRQVLTGRLNTSDNDNPAEAVRPFDKTAAGTVIGEGGGIVILEAAETFEKRGNGRAYAEVAGFGASQSVDRASRNREPASDGRAIAAAIRAAMREAQVTPDDIDAVFPFGSGAPRWDAAEANAMRLVFGDRLARVPVMSVKALLGNCGAGAGGIDLALAAKAIAEQKLPPVLNRTHPLDGLSNGEVAPANGTISHVLVFTTGYGGQNTAIILKRI
jgi:3-oxoacyl-[acyl-carrier-protein] synthase II